MSPAANGCPCARTKAAPLGCGHSADGAPRRLLAAFARSHANNLPVRVVVANSRSSAGIRDPRYAMSFIASRRSSKDRAFSAGDPGVSKVSNPLGDAELLTLDSTVKILPMTAVPSIRNRGPSEVSTGVQTSGPSNSDSIADRASSERPSAVPPWMKVCTQLEW